MLSDLGWEWWRFLGTDDFNTVCGVMVWNRDKIEKLRNWFTSAEQNWFSASALQKHISCVWSFKIFGFSIWGIVRERAYR